MSYARDNLVVLESNKIRSAIGTLPTSGIKPAPTPDFERYDERFNPATGIEIWLPIQPAPGL